MAFTKSFALAATLAFFLTLVKVTDAAQGFSRAQADAFTRQRAALVELDDASFRTSVLAKTNEAASHWVVLFYSKTDLQATGMMPSLETMFARLKERHQHGSSKARFGKLDCSRHTDLCGEVGVDSFPTVLRYRQAERAGSWTSGAKGLLPWLQEELASSSPSQDLSATMGIATVDEAVEQLWRAWKATGAARTAMFSVSHLEVVHDIVFMEDCLFARTLSFILLLAILGKSFWIVMDGAELRPSGGALARWLELRQKREASVTS